MRLFRRKKKSPSSATVLLMQQLEYVGDSLTKARVAISESYRILYGNDYVEKIEVDDLEISIVGLFATVYAYTRTVPEYEKESIDLMISGVGLEIYHILREQLHLEYSVDEFKKNFIDMVALRFKKYYELMDEGLAKALEDNSTEREVSFLLKSLSREIAKNSFFGVGEKDEGILITEIGATLLSTHGSLVREWKNQF